MKHYLNVCDTNGFEVEPHPRAVTVSRFGIENAPTVDAVPVVRCGDCLYWQDRQVMLSDGSCRNYLPDEPDYVTASVGINMGAHCTKHGFEDESGSWFWANACDFCSRGERRKYA